MVLNMQPIKSNTTILRDKVTAAHRVNNDEYDNKNDELDLIERFYKININVYTNDEPDIFMIDRRSINLFEDSIIYYAIIIILCILKTWIR